MSDPINHPGKLKVITIQLKSKRDTSQLAYLARQLRECAALNHGCTRIVIEHPNGDEEIFSVYPGNDGAEHQHVLNSYNWSKH